MVSKLLRDAVYCEGSTTVLEPAKSKKGEYVLYRVEVTEKGELEDELRACRLSRI